MFQFLSPKWTENELKTNFAQSYALYSSAITFKGHCVLYSDKLYDFVLHTSLQIQEPLLREWGVFPSINLLRPRLLTYVSTHSVPRLASNLLRPFEVIHFISFDQCPMTNHLYSRVVTYDHFHCIWPGHRGTKMFSLWLFTTSCSLAPALKMDQTSISGWLIT